MASGLQGKQKPECSYGERCYRKNPSHFEEYKHSHLNNLLKSLQTNGSQDFPESFKPKVSRETTREQLNIIREQLNLNPGASDIESEGKNSSSDHGNSTPLPEGKQNGLDVPSSSRKRHKRNEDDNDSCKEKIQIKPSTDRLSSAGEMDISHDMPSSSISSTLTSEQFRKKMAQASNMNEAMLYFQGVKQRSKGNICEKHKAAAPYYFFLTSVTDSRKTYSDPLTIQMFDILDPSLGDLESSLQINFMVEFGWLMAQYTVAKQHGKPLTILYGQMDVANLVFKNITAIEVKLANPFGTHHTKMCVLSYTDGSIRVCVHTANLVESDWDNRVQGVWLSPLCPALPLGSDTAAGESPTNFKRDLIQYLSAYKADLVSWINKLRRADFSQINVFFVASTPGPHKDLANSELWGHAKLARVLKSHASIPPKNGCPPSTWQIITQCSSIGSLGPEPTSWFCGEIKRSMSSGIGQSLQSLPPIRLIYPSFQNVADSYEGLLGGACLPYSKTVNDKQTWLQQYLYQWKSEKRHRTRGVPHIKTYTRVSPDHSQIAWFHLTSANLSKAAWGAMTNKGGINIRSYEAGVLFLPKFVLGGNMKTFPIKEEAAKYCPLFPLPYDLPLTKYASRDVPWFMENIS